MGAALGHDLGMCVNFGLGDVHPRHRMLCGRKPRGAQVTSVNASRAS